MNRKQKQEVRIQHNHVTVDALDEGQIVESVDEAPKILNDSTDQVVTSFPIQSQNQNVALSQNQNVHQMVTRGKKAMENEYQALIRNKTLKLVPYTCQKVVNCKWIFKTKFTVDGMIERHKARLVAKGFQQDPGVNFGETFSPVAKITTIRIILAQAVTLNWEVKQLDINNAFLNGYLNEDVFVSQPKGFVDSTFPNHVRKLSKALIYGLKQAPIDHGYRFIATRINWGFINNKGDTSLFVLYFEKLTLIILIYVDDILVTRNNNAKVQ